MKIEFYYSRKMPYGTSPEFLTAVKIKRKALPEFIRNYSALKLRGARTIRYLIESETAFQVAGYSENRGMFCDVMTYEQHAPFFPEGYKPGAYSTREEAAKKALRIIEGRNA